MFGIDDLFGAGIGLLGGVVNNLFAGSRQDDQQQFNAQQQLMAQNFNADQAAINRQYQSGEAATNRAFQSDQVLRAMQYATDMSNTSWQRSVNDMRRAGINPILAYQKGGASSPQISGASGGQGAGSAASSGAASSGIAQTFDIAGPAMSTAKSLQELENLKENANLTKEQANKTRMESITEGVRAGAVANQAGLSEAETRRLKALQPSFEAEGKRGENIGEFHGSTVGKWLDIMGLGAQRVGDIVTPFLKGGQAARAFETTFRDRWP